MTVDKPEVAVVEQIVLDIFEGDPSQKDKDSGKAKPVETLIIKKGKVVEHIIHKKDKEEK